MSTTLVRFIAVQRRNRDPKPCWVSSVRWADGDGARVKAVTFTLDRARAARFSTATAMRIAEQYYTSPAAIELADGTLLENETRLVLETQLRKAKAVAETRAAFRRDLQQLFADMPDDLRRSLMEALR